MNMKHSLQLRLSQHLTLTPQLQQSIRLLQLSTLELNQEIEQFLQENPLLEREETYEPAAVPASGPYTDSAPAASTDAPEAPEPEATQPESPYSASLDDDLRPRSGALRDDNDDAEYPQLAAGSPTLREHLMSQLSLTKLGERDRQLVGLLIDSLDDNGYLQDLEEITALLPAEAAVDLDDLNIAVKHLQHLDPPGVGARHLGECLRLQVEALPESTRHRAYALEIVTHHLDALATRDYAKLKKLLQCEDDDLRGASALITGLNPRPGSSYSSGEARYVVADVVVKKLKGQWVASLNAEAIPRLRINRLYADILQRNRDSSHQQLTSQLQEARWLIKNVQQRFETILRVSQAIVDRQRHFFEHGEVAMRPLVLREIADILGLHESTVSRVTTQKFMLTPRGIFELKYFFGSHVTTESGGAASSTAIRALIKQLVGAENTKKPLSDSQISEILGQQGIVVARRTVAKYRESMRILPVNLRRAI
jgi:RNA polymerase sigma-54 factor